MLWNWKHKNFWWIEAYASRPIKKWNLWKFCHALLYDAAKRTFTLLPGSEIVTVELTSGMEIDCWYYNYSRFYHTPSMRGHIHIFTSIYLVVRNYFWYEKNTNENTKNMKNVLGVVCEKHVIFTICCKKFNMINDYDLDRSPITLLLIVPHKVLIYWVS